MIFNIEECPSKYHRRVYSGRNKETTGGYEWSWESDHPDLEPTETVIIGNQHYCVYCCQKAYPIQAGLRRNSWSERGDNYDTTGYCCICESAEKEKEYKKKLIELNERYENQKRKEKHILYNEYKNDLKQDKKTLLKIEYEYNLKRLEWDEKHNI